MNQSWWQKGWDVNYQTVHWQHNHTWCQGKYWHNPNAKLLIVLLHGQMAHSHWWRVIAGYLAASYSVLAPDFSGMGDSDWRNEYKFSDHLGEVAHITELLGPGKHLIIGHSYGGFVGLCVPNVSSSQCVGYVMVDSPLQSLIEPPTLSNVSARNVPPVFYPDEQTILSRFRLVPAQKIYSPALVELIAKQSVLKTPSGWRWKFDPRLLGLLRYDQDARVLNDRKVYYIAGENSIFWDNSAADFVDKKGWSLSVVADSSHAILLDNSQELYRYIQDYIEELI